PGRGTGELAVEPANLQRPRSPSLLAEILEHRLQLLGPGPDAEDALADRGARRYLPLAQQFPGLATIVEAALEGEHVEAALLMQELDEPRAGDKRGPGTVPFFAEKDNARVADRLPDRLQVGIILIARINRAHGRNMFFEPGDARLGINR